MFQAEGCLFGIGCYNILQIFDRDVAIRFYFGRPTIRTTSVPDLILIAVQLPEAIDVAEPEHEIDLVATHQQVEPFEHLVLAHHRRRIRVLGVALRLGVDEVSVVAEVTRVIFVLA